MYIIHIPLNCGFVTIVDYQIQLLLTNKTHIVISLNPIVPGNFANVKDYKKSILN